MHPDEKSQYIQSFLETLMNIPEKNYIRFVILYGSVAEGSDDSNSDIDIAISCDLPDLKAEQVRMHILGRVPEIFDVHIFEHLPLYVKINVLKGNVLYVQDEDELYDTAYKIIREYEFFKPHYLDYIGEKAL